LIVGAFQRLFCVSKVKEAKDATTIYKNRRPIEQSPLASKQMIGAHSQFVSAEESSYRFPELTLLTGSVPTYLAAIFPPFATGFWDRKPNTGPLAALSGECPFLKFTPT